MPQAPKPLDPSLSARHRFGAELRRCRERRALSQAGLARLIHVSPDLVAKVEKADRRPSESLAETCDRLLGANGSLVALWPEIDRDRQDRPALTAPVDPELPTHWSRMLTVLTATDNAIGVRGLQGIVREELRLLARHRGAATGSIRRRFGQVQARWLEFASWVADNDGDPARAAEWLSAAGQLATEAGDNALASYVLMRQAQRAVEARDPDAAIAMADSATRNSRQPPRIRTLSLIRAAQAHALDGDRAGVQAHLARAYRSVEDSGCDSDDETLAGHCTVAYVLAHEANCQLLLGEPLAAIRAYRDALAGWPDGQRLDEGLFRAQLALASDAAGTLDEADAEGIRALALARHTGSQRTFNTLRVLAARRANRVQATTASGFLQAWRDESQVRAAS